MPDIILPRRSSGGRRRSRPARPIDASNVPQAGLARDPGLNVPKGAFGGGIGEGLDSLGGSLSNVSDDVQKIALANKKKEDAAKKTTAPQKPEQDSKPKKESEPGRANEPEIIEAANRQTKTYDATELNLRQDKFQTTIQETLTAAVTNGDLASPSELKKIKEAIDNETRTALSALDEDDALVLTPEARASLALSYGDTAEIAADTVDALHLQAHNQRANDQLAVSGDRAADQMREHMAALGPDENPLPILGLHFSLLDEKLNGFSGAFKDNREEGVRVDVKVGLAEQMTTALAEQGRGTDAMALLDSVLVSDAIGADARSRLKENVKIVGADAEQDRLKEEAAAARTAARERNRAALSFTTGFRTRMEDGTAKLSEIGTAQNAGILTKEQADGIRGEWTAREKLNQTNEAGITRVTSAIDARVRLDPNAPEDRDHVALHYHATLKPDLENLTPAEKATEIRGYVQSTGVAPVSALKTCSVLSPPVTTQTASKQPKNSKSYLRLI